MKTTLGLVCLTSSDVSKSDRISYKTITRTSLQKLSFVEQRAKLLSIYRDNIAMIAKALRFCDAHGIGMYRMSSGAFPFADDLRFQDLLDELATEFASVGNYAFKKQIRLLSHPDQFCILASSKMSVIENSIAMLRAEAKVFDLMGLPRSDWAPINIHIGVKGAVACETAVSVIRDLPPEIKNRLTLENCEYKQGAASTLYVCDRAEIPMLFDWHHELCFSNHDGYDADELYVFSKLASLTWSDPSWQVQHLSNGANDLHDRKHSDLITMRPSDLSAIPWLELEAKWKEQAIAAFPW